MQNVPLLVDYLMGGANSDAALCRMLEDATCRSRIMSGRSSFTCSFFSLERAVLNLAQNIQGLEEGVEFLLAYDNCG